MLEGQEDERCGVGEAILAGVVEDLVKPLVCIEAQHVDFRKPYCDALNIA